MALLGGYWFVVGMLRPQYPNPGEMSIYSRKGKKRRRRRIDRNVHHQLG
jgi:hypothetical protein